MSNVKLDEIKIKTDAGKTNEVKVAELKLAGKPIVKDFDFHPINSSSQKDYSIIKAKYGPLAATDAEQAKKNQRDSRFSLNPLLREPLSVEQEERRVIEEKVRTRVQALEEEARTKAEAIGYQEGLKKGHEAAFKKFEEEGIDRLNKLDQLIAEMVNAKTDVYRANERFLIELIFRIAKMVILRELSTDRDYLIRLARELITRSGTRDNITIKVNPEDAHTVEDLKEGLMKAFGQLSNLNIETSNQVMRGGCQVETEWNAIDASVEKQLEAIHQALIGKQLTGGES